jgi:predicted metal-binding membrane protein
MARLRYGSAARTDPATLAWIMGGLVVAAWLALWRWGASPYAHYLDHGQRPSDPDGWTTLALFLAGWTLMVVAMMLPTATALLQAFGAVVRRRPGRGWLQAAMTVGFVASWLLVGYLFRAADLGVHRLVASVGWLQARPQLLGGATLVLAGLYQLSPLKYRCLVACRSPRSFIYRHWQGRRPAGDALRIGMAYGWSCVGCCWALMLVMFALGLSSLLWMLGLGVVMAAEKTTRAGLRLAVPVGGLLVAAGIAVLLHNPGTGVPGA